MEHEIEESASDATSKDDDPSLETPSDTASLSSTGTVSEEKK
jgi:hypothetical protein